MERKTNTRIKRKNNMKTITSLLLITALLFVTTPVSLASQYDVEMVVQSGKKSKETDSVLEFSETGMTLTPDKKSFKTHTKTFAYSDIIGADHSYSKKPMLSSKGAVATMLLVCFVCAVPFLFVKKKSHWLIVKTEEEFTVIKLRKSNFRSIIAEFETKKVEVTEVEEEKKKDK
jgi:hypothetical protein